MHLFLGRKRFLLIPECYFLTSRNQQFLKIRRPGSDNPARNLYRMLQNHDGFDRFDPARINQFPAILEPRSPRTQKPLYIVPILNCPESQKLLKNVTRMRDTEALWPARAYDLLRTNGK